VIHVEVIIPFRDRGIDPRRGANLDVVDAWWFMHGFDPKVVTDGLEGDAQFNRHRAYNRAVAANPADVYVFTEADMLIHPDQITQAVRLAVRKPGLVVPFTQYRYLDDTSTEVLRDGYHDDSISKPHWWGEPAHSPTSVFAWIPESTMDNGRSIGAVNVVSRETLELTGGFTEATEGNWYDDRIIEEGFKFLCDQPTQHVPGPAVHLYHLPGHAGDHLTEADKRATRRNRDILVRLRADIRMQQTESVKRLMSYREGVQR
jgi:hypothetical protein